MFRNLLEKTNLFFDYYREKMDLGDYYLKLGDVHSRNQDLNQAKKAYEEAIKSGNLMGYLKLSAIAKAQNNPSQAGLYIGIMQETLQNWSNAVSTYEAMDQSDGLAQYRLGLLYSTNRYRNNTLILSEDKQKAVIYYAEAAKKGNLDALNQLTIRSRTDADAAYYLAQVFIDKPNKRLEVINLLLFSLKAKHTPSEECLSLWLDRLDQKTINQILRKFVQEAQRGNQHAIENLKLLAQLGNAPCQYILGHDVYLQQKNFQEGIHWCLLAVAKNYTPAVKYLSGTKFNAEEYLIIAEKYYKGDGVKRNIKQALDTYQNAYLLNNKEAALFLGKFYLTDQADADIKKDHDKACEYLMQATNWKDEDEEAFRSLIALEQTISSAMQMKLAGMYEANQYWEKAYRIYCLIDSEYMQREAAYRKGLIFSTNRYRGNHLVIERNEQKELFYYATAAAGRNRSALQTLTNLSKKNANAAFALACLYKNISSREREVVSLLIFAASRKYPGALDQLVSLQKEGKLLDDEQLEFGNIHLNEGDISEALKCFKYLADKKHAEAEKKLAIIINDPGNAYLLAQLYELDNSETSKKTALNYYVEAAHKDHQPSLERLITLATSRDKMGQYALGFGYYYNKGKIDNAFYWCVLSAQQSFEPACNFLSNRVFSAWEYTLLAEKYYKGENDIQRDIPRAISYYEKAYVLKDKEAALFLGRFYLEGNQELSNKPDYEKAYEYLTQAVNYGALSKALPLLRELEDKINPAMRMKLAFIYEAHQNWVDAMRIYLNIQGEYENQAAYRISILYSDDRYQNNLPTPAIRKNKEQEFAYFMKAAEMGNIEALEIMRDESREKPKAAYLLAHILIKDENQFSEAIDLLLSAAQKKHNEALKDLESMRSQNKLSDNAILQLAKVYLDHLDNKKLACRYIFDLSNKGYQPATSQIKKLVLQDPALSYEFALLYESTNFKLTCRFLISAAKRQSNEALIKLESHIKQLPDKSYYQLGRIYYHRNDITNALKCFMKLADQGYVAAKQEIEKIAQKPEQAFFLAQLYEESENISDEMISENAINHYLFAANKGHQLSLNRLIALADAGNPIIQYRLALEYYVNIGEIKKAIPWLLSSAEKKYEPAEAALSKTKFTAEEYLLIAEKYQYGEGVEENSEKALEFYKKSYSLKNKNAALALGYFWLDDHPELAMYQDIDKACGFFIEAALLGSEKALTALECNGSGASDKTQSKIADMYRNPSLKDPFKELQWREKLSIFAKNVNHNKNLNPNNNCVTDKMWELTC